MRLLLIVCGVLLLITGMVILPLPLPFGALMMGIGLGILVTQSHIARQVVKRARGRSPKLHAWLYQAKRYMPRAVRKGFEETEVLD